jgi:hypothetical protein
MTLQMADDYADWKEDLADGSYNGLLAMIAADRSDRALPLTEKEAENAIYIRGCMNKYVQLAADNHAKLLELEAESAEMEAFHYFILDHLNQTCGMIESRKQQLLKGGFSYFLFNSVIQ